MVRILTTAWMVVAFGSCAVAAAAGPCDLVTKAEVQEAVGGAVSEARINPNNKAVCDYVMAAATSVLNVTLTDKGAADSAERTVAELKKRKIAAEVVSGLGDGAYASSPGYGMQQLGVYKGPKQVIVTVLIMGGTEAKSKQIAEKVMRKALGRL